ncbi:MAG TPA: pyridoxal-phosphate dependent enzyme [Pyrinomonadaceae bacterium]|nr:pyridoxal-phosphate dependent enzyme [Pyrinomonadaceae bacterium]
MKSFQPNERYSRLFAAAGKTKMVELKHLTLPNENRLFAKLEYQNPGGSHYDRVYLELFHSLEESGEITPGKTRVVETTTGNAGASLAWVASQLGYECTVIIPADVAETRKRQIQDRGAQLLQSPPGEYVRGVIQYLKRYLVEHREEYDSGRLYCLNHSKNPLSIHAVANVADEINDELLANGLTSDVLILGCGNGTTIMGIGGRLKTLSPDSQVIVFDPFEAPVAYERKYPGKFEKQYRVKPESQPHRHRILGTGGWGVSFPHIEDPSFLEIVDEVFLVREEVLIETQKLLALKEQLYPGRSSAAAVAVALEKMKSVHGKNIVVVFYDELNFYPEPEMF